MDSLEGRRRLDDNELAGLGPYGRDRGEEVWDGVEKLPLDRHVRLTTGVAGFPAFCPLCCICISMVF